MHARYESLVLCMSLAFRVARSLQFVHEYGSIFLLRQKFSFFLVQSGLFAHTVH
jgi:hypothetical protein